MHISTAYIWTEFKTINNFIFRNFWQFGKHDIDSVLKRLEPFLDVRFKDGFLSNLNGSKSKNTASGMGKSKKNNFGQIRSISTRSKALYDNCLLEAPDGEVLCTIDHKKAKW